MGEVSLECYPQEQHKILKQIDKADLCVEKGDLSFGNCKDQFSTFGMRTTTIEETYLGNIF